MEIRLTNVNLLISRSAVAGSELMVRPSLRTRSVGARLTAAEYASLERQAEASDQSLSEWCREVMLASVNGQALKSRQSVGTEVQANSESLTAGGNARAHRRADADKLKKGAERLSQRKQVELDLNDR